MNNIRVIHRAVAVAATTAMVAVPAAAAPAAASETQDGTAYVPVEKFTPTGPDQSPDGYTMPPITPEVDAASIGAVTGSAVWDLPGFFQLPFEDATYTELPNGETEVSYPNFQYWGNGQWSVFEYNRVTEGIGSNIAADYRYHESSAQERAGRDLVVSSLMMLDRPLDMKVGRPQALRVDSKFTDRTITLMWGDGTRSVIEPGCQQGHMVLGYCVTIATHTFDTPGEYDLQVKVAGKGKKKAEKITLDTWNITYEGVRGMPSSLDEVDGLPMSG